jgi:cytochrome P450
VLLCHFIRHIVHLLKYYILNTADVSEQFETVRLYSSVLWVPRETTSNIEIIPLSRGNSRASTAVPPNTDVHLNMYARQISSEIWGSDVLQFRPDRFVVSSDKPVPAGWMEHGSGVDGEEKLVTPPISHFSPWLLGPRICPGMKFSQVCFSGLFHAH